jgi:hypothetical protein
MNLAIERIESLKAGIIGSLGISLAFGLIAGAHLVFEVPSEIFPSQMSTELNLSVLFSGAIALLSGFLFGVTYRYVIRVDNNPQLKLGAVFAFGLVRGLSELDGDIFVLADGVALLLNLTESVALFAIAQLLLDGALQHQWVKPFDQ